MTTTLHIESRPRYTLPDDISTARRIGQAVLFLSGWALMLVGSAGTMILIGVAAAKCVGYP